MKNEIIPNDGIFCYYFYFMQERSCGEFEAIAMGFGGLMEKEIPQAIALFKQAWDAALV